MLVKSAEVLQLLLTRSQQVSMEMSGCNVSWADLWKAEPQSKQFLIQAVYDVLSSLSSLFS